jgi:hypothetical protein
LGIAQEHAVQGRALVDHLFQISGGDPQPLTRMLHEVPERGSADTKHHGNTNQTLSTLETVQSLSTAMASSFLAPGEARVQAVVAAGEALEDLDGKFWDGTDWRMWVTDESGATVCKLTFSAR